jgi:hypothetical protein
MAEASTPPEPVCAQTRAVASVDGHPFARMLEAQHRVNIADLAGAKPDPAEAPNSKEQQLAKEQEIDLGPLRDFMMQTRFAANAIKNSSDLSAERE